MKYPAVFFPLVLLVWLVEELELGEASSAAIGGRALSSSLSEVISMLLISTITGEKSLGV